MAVFFLYWPLARWRASALALILFANYFFFAQWDLIYLILIPVASMIDFILNLSDRGGSAVGGAGGGRDGAICIPLQLATECQMQRLAEIKNL